MTDGPPDRLGGVDEWRGTDGSKGSAAGYRRRATKERVVPRDKIILECTECRSRNFFQTKNRRKHPERVEYRKYCPRCDKHRAHKESK